jgi:hypothetical protein
MSIDTDSARIKVVTGLERNRSGLVGLVEIARRVRLRQFLPVKIIF